MTGPAPLISVVMATWGRGRHVRPSIRSALQQDFRDFELIVAGDACDDETEQVVAEFADQGVRWINLASRVGSQSGPNNAGIAAARGSVIAYLGHDDIWEPSHLGLLAKGFAGDPRPDFVISGIIGYKPEGIPGCLVWGLFTEDSAKHLHFFPPSSMAHLKLVPDRIGPWRMPMDIPAPVDEDFLLRAAAADMRFVSTRVITVHKFTSAQRYLSYVRQESWEQEAMLARMTTPEHGARITALVEEAKRLRTFMPLRSRDFSHLSPGHIARENAVKRGLSRPELRELGDGATIRQRVEACALDWRNRPVLGIRFHSQNPRPRFLLPYSAHGPVLLRCRVVHHDRAAFGPIRLSVNDTEVEARPSRVRPSLWGWTAVYQAEIELLPGAPTILTFHLSSAQLRKLGAGRFLIGFGLGKLRLVPATRA
jgi:glycosyltransferase involved in cell wall biosynthesis